VYVISQKRRARGFYAVALAAALSWSVVGGARAADTSAPDAASPAGAPATAATPPATAEVSKAECLSRYEGAQLARRERRLLDARASLRVCSGVSCPSAVRADCVDWLDQLAHSIPSFVVTARARGADVFAVKVFVDGKLMAERLTGFAIELDPGPHKFRFESPPWPVIEREVLASEGVKDRPIDVEFAPPLPPAMSIATSPDGPPPGFRLQRSDYVFGGVALAGFATLAYFGGTGLYDADQLKQSCGSGCPPQDVDAVRTKLIIADIGLAVAVVALAMGLYLHGKPGF
jgi:hypothetical protein